MNPLNQALAGSGNQKADELAKITRSVQAKEMKLKSQLAKNASIIASTEKPDDVDWTKTYKNWDMWEDTEDISSTLSSERTRQESMIQQQQSMTGCGSHDRSAERRIAEMDMVERLALMRKCREEGNDYYDEGQYARAGIKYKRSLIYFEYCFPENDEEDKASSEIRFTCLSNTVACLIKLGKYDDALESVIQALDMEPDNVKCLFRRALVYRMKDEFDLAKDDINKAIQIDPINKRLRQERELLRGKSNSYNANRKAMGNKMFQRNPKNSDSEGGEEKKDNAPPDENEPDAALIFSNFQSDPDSIISQSLGDKTLQLDDLFVPISIDMSSAERLVNELSGINLMDATTLRGIGVKEVKAKGGLGWAFRHPGSCECSAPEIEIDFESDDEDEEEEEELKVLEVKEAEVKLEETKDEQRNDLLDAPDGLNEVAVKEEENEEEVITSSKDESSEKQEQEGEELNTLLNVLEKIKDVDVRDSTYTEECAAHDFDSTPLMLQLLSAAVFLLIVCRIANLPAFVLIGVGLVFGLFAEKKLKSSVEEKVKVD